MEPSHSCNCSSTYEYLEDSDELERRFLPSLIDTHNHATDDAKCWKKLPSLQLSRIVCMSSEFGCWAKMEKLATLNVSYNITLSFGIHPWMVWKPRPGDWVEQLKNLLEKYPKAIVGEIGLDKVATMPKTKIVLWDDQMAVFSAAFDVACKLNRPISFHCVKAFGPALDFFKSKPTESFPPTVIFHSFSGPKDMIWSYLKLPKIGKRFYFGFSTVINVRESAPSQRLIDAIKATPADRILLESDWNNVDAFETAMLEIHRLVAEIKGWSLEETATITTKNAIAALAGEAP